jgi:hypothetical protein
MSALPTGGVSHAAAAARKARTLMLLLGLNDRDDTSHTVCAHAGLHFTRDV